MPPAQQWSGASLRRASTSSASSRATGWTGKPSPATNPDSQLHWQTDFHPDPSVRRLPEDYPVNSDASPIAPYMYNAVGGSTVHYGSHYPRFHPSDFRVRTLDGVADDWPLTYDELEPYFDLNDRIMGVSGLRGDPAYPPKPERPCPPLSIRPGGEVLAKGFDKLGWHWWASDTAIASVEYDGRDPDSGGYLRSLASTDLTYWPKALELGARLITKARVREILVDNTGKATGVLYYNADGNLVEQRAKSVVMACNGIGTPRLLLNSTSPLFPDGVANSSGLVGKCLMHHPAGVVVGVLQTSGWVPRMASPVAAPCLARSSTRPTPAEVSCVATTCRSWPWAARLCPRPSADCWASASPGASGIIKLSTSGSATPSASP